MSRLFGSQSRASFRENGERPVVALLEARMSRELSRLVEKHGGNPLCVPALREVSAAPIEVTRVVIDELVNARHEVVVFMTGVAASLLFEVAEQEGRRQELVQGLRNVTTVARGPKPTAACAALACLRRSPRASRSPPRS